MRPLRIILGLVLLAVLGAATWFLFGYAWNSVLSLGANAAGAIIAALAGLVGVLYTQWQSKSRDIAESHRGEKIRVYTLFFDIVEDFMQRAKEDPEPLQEAELSEEQLRRFAELTRGFIVWASPKVIRAWLEFRQRAAEGPGVMLQIDDVLQAIRKDLGNSNFGLSRGDIVKLYLSNPEELDSIK